MEGCARGSLGFSRTGMQVKRPALGAEGFVLDHMNRAATDAYLKTAGDRLFQAFGNNNRPYWIFGDSLEIYNSDWTEDLRNLWMLLLRRISAVDHQMSASDKRRLVGG